MVPTGSVLNDLSSQDDFGGTQTQVDLLEARRAAEPARRARTVRTVEEATAPEDPVVGAACPAQSVPNAWFTTVRDGPVLAPFPHVAVDVVQPECIGAIGAYVCVHPVSIVKVRPELDVVPLRADTSRRLDSSRRTVDAGLAVTRLSWLPSVAPPWTIWQRRK